MKHPVMQLIKYISVVCISPVSVQDMLSCPYEMFSFSSRHKFTQQKVLTAV